MSELHAKLSPESLSGGTHLRRSDLLIGSFACVEEGEQSVACRVHVEAVVLRRTIAQVGYFYAIVVKLLHASRVQALQKNAVADRRRAIRIGIEPAHIPSIVRERPNLWLHLVVSVTSVRERKVLGWIGRPLCPSGRS